jgi:hypothetical protein
MRIKIVGLASVQDDIGLRDSAARRPTLGAYDIVLEKTFFDHLACSVRW